MHVWEVVGSLVLCAGLAGCAGGKAAQRDDQKSATAATAAVQRPAASASTADAPERVSAQDPQRQINVAVDPKLTPPQRAIWLGYALGVATQRIKTLKAGQPIDRLGEEAAGLGAAVAVWSESQQQVGPDEYLSALAKVVAAGYTEEYALRYYARPGWRLRPEKLATLKLAAFSRWADKHLPRHLVRRGSEVSFASDGPPLGSELGERMPEFKTDCAGIPEKLRLLIGEWEGQRAKLPERLYSSVDSAQFFRSIERLQAAAGLAPLVPAEVHWISPAVGTLYNAAAFCAIEARNGPLAEAYLRKSLQINPAHANGYGELAFVLIQQRRFADALVEIEQGLLVTDDPCLQAMLWRKRGYVFIELDQLAAARGAYVRSLELSPKNQLALSEMQVIEQKMSERGLPFEPLPAVAQGTARPPAVGDVVLSTCE